LTVAFKAATQPELMFRDAAKRSEETAGYKLNCASIGWTKSNKLHVLAR
jgi:hypothetical protein